MQRETASALQHETHGLSVAGPPAAGRDAAAPPLRLPGPQAALRPLHPRDGRAGVRHLQGDVPRALRGVDGQLGPGPDHRAGLQRRLDPAQRRRAVHPHRRHPAAAAGQHGAPGRRHHGAARSRQHPGVDRHPHAVQPAARLPAHAQRADHQSLEAWVDSVRHPGAKGFWDKAGAYGVNMLKAWWGEAATPENDFCFDYLPRITGDHGTYRTVLDMIDGKVKGYFLLGQNPAVGSANGRPSDSVWRTSTGWSCGTCSRSRARRFWKNAPEIETGEIVTGGVSHRGVPAARQPPTWRRKARSPRRSGCCSGARRPSSRRTTAAPSCGSSTTWAGWSGSGWPAPPTGARPSAAGPGLGLPRPRGDRRPQRRGGAEGDQRLRGRHRSGAVDVHRDEGRRLDPRRVLDLHRRLQGRRQPGCPAHAAPEQSWVAPGVGLGVAGQPADALQPCLGRPGGQAVERAQGLRVVGRGGR